MNTLLLGVIRSEVERRNAPAVRAVGSRPGKDPTPPETHPNFLRRFRNHVGEVIRAATLAIAVKQLHGKMVVLPGSGHKMDEVRAELIEAGVPSSEIEHLSDRGLGDWTGKKIGLFGHWLISAVGLRATLVKRLSSRSRRYANVIFQYAITRRVLRQCPGKAYWCVIGDLSPTLIALAAGVRAEGHQLLSWQYGYQDFKHFPVRPDIAVVLNATGIELARVGVSGKAVPVLQRRTINPKPITFKEVSSGIVGVVLNAFSRKDVLSTIQAIARQLETPILVRPHPRDSEMRKLVESRDVKLAPTGSLDEFCASVDWMICGNTTSALKIRGMGFPVCQYFGFDHFFRDHFGYKAMGILPGFEDPLEISEHKVRSFYETDQNSAALKRLFGVTDMVGVLSLNSISELIFESAARKAH